jgi:hypothetical protein
VLPAGEESSESRGPGFQPENSRAVMCRPVCEAPANEASMVYELGTPSSRHTTTRPAPNLALDTWKTRHRPSACSQLELG